MHIFQRNQDTYMAKVRCTTHVRMERTLYVCDGGKKINKNYISYSFSVSWEVSKCKHALQTKRGKEKTRWNYGQEKLNWRTGRTDNNEHILYKIELISRKKALFPLTFCCFRAISWFRKKLSFSSSHFFFFFVIRYIHHPTFIHFL